MAEAGDLPVQNTTYGDHFNDQPVTNSEFLEARWPHFDGVGSSVMARKRKR